MTVSSRITLGVCTLMALALVVFFYQISTLRAMQHTNDNLSNVDFANAARLQRLAYRGGELYDLTRKYFALDSNESRARLWPGLQDHIQAFDREIDGIQAGLRNWEAPAAIRQVSTTWDRYRTNLESARLLNPAGSLTLPFDLDPAFVDLDRQTAMAYDAVLKAIAEQVAENRATGDRAKTVSLYAGVLFILLGGTLAFLTVRSINGPLSQLTEGARTLTRGEFSLRLPVSGPFELAELARDFNAMSARLGELDQMKKDFVAHVSHELKAPLAAIRQTLAVILEQIPGPINAQQQKLLLLSRKSAERLSAMVANLLDAARLESGTMEYEMSGQDLGSLVREAAEEFMPQARERNMPLVVDIDDAMIPLHCDHDRMIQVVSNLIDNALKFSAAGGAVHVRVRRRSTESGPVAAIAVTDRGPGVPGDHKENVFLKFHQVKKSGTRVAGQGVGLGLSICRTIVEAHRGRIWVEDNPGGGSVFIIELRADRNPDHEREGVLCG